jgi:hypothetical protein
MFIDFQDIFKVVISNSVGTSLGIAITFRFGSWVYKSIYRHKIMWKINLGHSCFEGSGIMY